MKKIRYIFEAALVYCVYIVFKTLPLSIARSFGAWLGRILGPLFSSHKTSLQNLSIAFPEMKEEEKHRIIQEMWESLGRVFAEYPHLEKIAKDHLTVNGLEHIQDILKADQPMIFIGIHQGNWELNCLSSLFYFDKPVHVTYRAPNNPYVDRLLIKARTLDGRIKAFPKGREAGKDIMRTMKNGEYLGIMLDQKYNEGLSIPFFGRPAMTNPIAVELAQKYEATLVPVQNTRKENGDYQLTIHPPLILRDKDNTPLATEDILKTCHLLFESWIKDNPEQWLWAHNRWPEKPEIN